jgi:hypothetical protein
LTWEWQFSVCLLYHEVSNSLKRIWSRRRYNSLLGYLENSFYTKWVDVYMADYWKSWINYRNIFQLLYIYTAYGQHIGYIKLYIIRVFLCISHFRLNMTYTFEWTMRQDINYVYLRLIISSHEYSNFKAARFENNGRNNSGRIMRTCAIYQL